MADGVPFKEAIDFLAGKVNLPTRRWDDLQEAGHVRGFAVAGVTRDDMLADFRAAIEKARRDGTGFNEFRKDFDAIVERTGWQFFSHGKTEEERRAWRAHIIYTTNMRTSYMAGRWSQLTDPDILRYRPYLQYIHSGALHPRKLHLSWNNRVWLATDPVWKVIYPPNGWGCGCDVEALSDRELRAMGKSGPDEPLDLQPYQEKNPRTGEMETRYPGIDRGWAYNVGDEWLNGIVPRELRDPLPAFGQPPIERDLPAMPPATPVAADALLPEGLTAESYADAFLHAFELKNNRGYYRDASGGLITLSKALFDDGTESNTGRYATLIAETIKTPDEIWVDWAQTTVGAALLRRSYIRNVTLASGEPLALRTQWTKAGWNTTIGFGPQEDLIASWRRGSLLFRK